MTAKERTTVATTDRFRLALRRLLNQLAEERRGKSRHRGRDLHSGNKVLGRFARIKWMFTSEKARNKMAKAYPTPTNES